MSAALVQSFEELLITAVTRLTAEIKAETDPKRLETLFTLAFRARIPRAIAAPQEPAELRRPTDAVTTRAKAKPASPASQAIGGAEEERLQHQRSAGDVLADRRRGADSAEPGRGRPLHADSTTRRIDISTDSS